MVMRASKGQDLHRSGQEPAGRVVVVLDVHDCDASAERGDDPPAGPGLPEPGAGQPGYRSGAEDRGEPACPRSDFADPCSGSNGKYGEQPGGEAGLDAGARRSPRGVAGTV